MANSWYLVVVLGHLVSAAMITVDKSDGGYEDIVVGISPSVEPNEHIITNIKALFQSASLFLHQATEGRLYFKRVTIVIPKTWPDRANVEWTSANLYDSSDIRIAPPNPRYNDTPYTIQPRGCGEPGDYIHLTPNFLINLRGSTEDNFGDPAYHLVHEWAHFRYGVYDEYGSPDDEEFPSVYCEDNKVFINSCTRPKFLLLSTKHEPCKLESNCKLSKSCSVYFMGDAREASIMSMPHQKSITKFCDQSELRQHNANAPNKHNKLCNRKPTWEVISQNADFVGLAPPLLGKNTMVTFRELQRSKDRMGRVVLVLDVSGSMIYDHRLDHVKNAATFYVKHLAPEGIQLGIVSFSSWASTLQDVVEVNSASRKDLVQAIDMLDAMGGTAIGQGLLEGLKALKKDGHSAEGGTLILMTDGGENLPPYMFDVLPDLLKEHVRVHTLALGGSADEKLEKLSEATRGKTYFFKDFQNNTELYMEVVFDETTNDHLDAVDRSMIIRELTETLLHNKEVNFTIDNGMGNGTKLFIFTNSTVQLNVTVFDPTGKVCSKCVVISEPGRVIINIPAPAMEGAWKAAVQSLSGGQPMINLRVYSKAKNASQPPISLHVIMNRAVVNGPLEAKIFAEIVKGGNAVVGANVTAVVERPEGASVRIPLYDDGTGADVTANDGMYSAYFTQFNGKGRYSVVVSAEDGLKTTIMQGRAGSSGSRLLYKRRVTPPYSPVFSYEIGKDIQLRNVDPGRSKLPVRGPPTGKFARISHGGSFQTTEAFIPADIAPGAITDMAADVVIHHANQTFSVPLSWTCPGAHMDFGHASHIELRASLNKTELLERFDSAKRIDQGDLYYGDLSLLVARSRQVIRVNMARILPSCSLSNVTSLPDVYFAARVWNHDNKSSDVSNIVTAYISQCKAEKISIIISSG